LNDVDLRVKTSVNLSPTTPPCGSEAQDSISAAPNVFSNLPSNMPFNLSSKIPFNLPYMLPFNLPSKMPFNLPYKMPASA
jgi:hypothetical protein